jgi:hypothetical protein
LNIQNPIDLKRKIVYMQQPNKDVIKWYTSISVAFMLLLFLPSCAQTKNSTQLHAFFKQENPGTQMVDESGQPISGPLYLTRVLYLQAPVEMLLQVDSVRYGKQALSASHFPEPQSNLKVGKMNNSGKEIQLAAEKGNQWWRIEVTPTDPGLSTRNIKNRIRVYGKLAGKPYVWEASNETELQAEARY